MGFRHSWKGQHLVNLCLQGSASQFYQLTLTILQTQAAKHLQHFPALRVPWEAGVRSLGLLLKGLLWLLAAWRPTFWALSGNFHH